MQQDDNKTIKKHAYLLIYHRDDYNFKVLLKTIDDTRNDIFVLIDKKTKKFDFETVKSVVKHSRIIFIPRRKIIWGGDSQVKAELDLIEYSYNFDEYTYYHIMAGDSLCIKTQDEIHRYFDRYENELFLGYSHDEKWLITIKERIQYYYLQAGRNKFKRMLNRINILVQKIFRINRIKKMDMEIVGGCNWCSLPITFVSYVLSKKKQIIKIFSHSYCADELFLHMIAYNDISFRNCIHEDTVDNWKKEDIYKSNLNYIDWNRGCPYTFQISDFEDLTACPYFFARKFTYSDDNNLIEKICKYNNIDIKDIEQYK